MKKILLASDHGGFALKEGLKAYLEKKGFKVEDLGTYSEESCDYPEFAYALAKRVASGKGRRGVLICKSGIGNAIVANKVPGVRAALCHNLVSARLSREHNDSNVLAMGAIFVGVELAKKMLDVWLKTAFAGGRHIKRLNQIEKIEREINNRAK